MIKPHSSNMILSADTLLEIPVTQPELLFAGDEGQARSQWQTLSRHWHPDRNPDPRAAWVFGHITELRQAAAAKRAIGIWQDIDALLLTAVDGRRYRLRYGLTQPLDVGTAFIGKTVLCYLLEEDYADLTLDAPLQSPGLPFADDAMRLALEPLLPQPVARIRLRQGVALVLRKSPQYIPLRRLLDYVGGCLDPRHVAWIVSSILNLVCYLDSVNLAHQAIGIDHLLVAPAEHSVALTGGWWYSRPAGEPLKALPERSMRLAPPDILARKTADIRLDQHLLRATALELLGEDAAAAPAPMLSFFQLPPMGCPVTDYEHWQQVLWESFGERRFTPLAITADDIYGMTSH